MKSIFIAFFLVLVMLFTIGCSTEKNDTIGIRGEVTTINTSGDTITLIVKGEIEKDTVYDKASVAIKPETRVVRRQDGTDLGVSPEDIKLYDKVEVVFEGAVAESYPVQGTAKLVRILSQDTL